MPRICGAGVGALRYGHARLIGTCDEILELFTSVQKECILIILEIYDAFHRKYTLFAL